MSDIKVIIEETLNTVSYPMKTPYKNKKDGVRAIKRESFWMGLIPLVALVCCLLILWPHATGLWDYLRAENETAQEKSVQTPAPTYGPSLAEREWDACGGDARELVISASSYERDMTVVVRDGNNNVVTGEQFGVTLTDSAGEQNRYRTKTDGSCYIVELTPGDYYVELEASGGYAAPQGVVCTVRAGTQYHAIENISQMINVYDISQMSPSEVKNEPSVSEYFVPEIIFTPTEAAYVDMSAYRTPPPVTDSLGNQLYDYDFHLGSNGCLLYSGTEQESDVLPVDEDGDGVYEYGIRYEAPPEASITPVYGSDAAQEEPQSEESFAEGFYTSVSLFNADNTPVALYAIDASPVTEKPEAPFTGVGWKTENGHTYYIGSDGMAEVGLKSIDGKLYYFNNRGEKASSLGIDVSCFNGHIDWSTVKSQGIDFAMIRLGGRGWSSGSMYEDTFIQEHMQGAKNAGIKVGVYFYSMAVNTVEAVQEASVALEKLNGTHLDYPIFIDMEYSGNYPDGRADKLPTAQRVEIANAFCKTVMSSGYTAGIYASESFMRSALDYGALSRYTYWLANYTENNAMPAFSGRYDIWQFTNAGQIGGISGPVDLNVIL